MENKFFNVEIGRTTRAGNMQVQHSFVASVPKSKNQYEVHNYYQSQYSGFDVSVSEAKEVLFPIFVDTKVIISANSEHKPSLIKKSRIEHYASISSFTDETKILWKDARKKEAEANDAKEHLIKILQAEIRLLYNNAVSVVRIDHEKFMIDSGTVRYKADISGTLIMEEIEKAL